MDYKTFKTVLTPLHFIQDHKKYQCILDEITKNYVAATEKTDFVDGVLTIKSSTLLLPTDNIHSKGFNALMKEAEKQFGIASIHKAAAIFAVSNGDVFVLKCRSGLSVGAILKNVKLVVG